MKTRKSKKIKKIKYMKQNEIKLKSIQIPTSTLNNYANLNNTQNIQSNNIKQIF